MRKYYLTQFRKIINKNQQEFLLVMIFTKNSGSMLIMRISEDMSFDSLNKELKNPINWVQIYSQSDEVLDIYFSVHYDSALGNPSSVVIVKDNYRFTYIEFKSDITQHPDNPIMSSQEIDFKGDLKPGKIRDLTGIVGVHHYNSLIFLVLKHSVYIYSYKAKRMIDMWEFDKETLADLYILDKQQFYYLIFMTTRNVYFSLIHQTKLEEFVESSIN